MSDSTPSLRDDMLQMVNGYELSRAIHVAAVLGVADFLMDGPRTVDDLAAATGAHAPTLHRLLRALASVGIFVEDTTGWFGLTDRAEYLRSDVSGSLRYWAMASGGRSFWASWGDLLESVRTGEAAFPRQHGMTNWEYRARLPDEGAAFDAAMTANSRAVADIIAAHYDFSKFGVVPTSVAARECCCRRSSPPIRRCAGSYSTSRVSLRTVATVCKWARLPSAVRCSPVTFSSLCRRARMHTFLKALSPTGMTFRPRRSSRSAALP